MEPLSTIQGCCPSRQRCHGIQWAGGRNAQQEGYAWKRSSVYPGSFIKTPLPGGIDKDEPDFAVFVMNAPTSGSWETAARVGNFSCIYIWKQNTEQALAPRAAQTGMRPWGLQLQAGQACLCHLARGRSKSSSSFFEVAQARHCWSLARRVTKPTKAPLAQQCLCWWTWYPTGIPQHRHTKKPSQLQKIP